MVTESITAGAARQKKRLGIAIAWLASLTLLTLVILRLFVYEPFRVRSDSMYPNAPKGSLVIVDRSGFSNAGPLRLWKRAPTASVHRGDIIAFLISDGATVYLFRVIGLPGDRVSLSGRQLTINDQPVLAEVTGPLVQEGGFAYQHATETIGDRDVSIAWLPSRMSMDFAGTVPEGHYFMLGDNRDNARDSRFAEVGFVAKDRMVGRVVRILSL